MLTIKEYSAMVGQAIANLDLDSRKPEQLYQPIAYTLEGGGKRLRPVMLLMAADAFGGNAEKATEPAAGIEIFHNFTLLHDDVMDSSDTRHGLPTVHKKWDENTAILSGDAMLTLATELIAQVEPGMLPEILKTFNQMAMRLYDGQRLDMDFEKRDDVSPAEYREMIEGKTGALMGAAARIGALIGGSSAEDARKMEEFGMHLGVAFQIQDDWLDVYGNPATFGKPIGGDILNDKKTFLRLTAIERAGSLRNALNSSFSLPPSEEKIKSVRGLYTLLGVSDIAAKTVTEESEAAISALEATSMPEEGREAFRKLAESLVGRDK